ncbi:MAG: NUDIX hydrolase [Candidatus Protistobacter heckmanni]|nr:NUDIX hydrolase [Candidatus Protistobacter heckmanni]
MNTSWKPRVTVAAVIEREGRFFLVEEDTAEGLKLNQPAGHLDSGESLLQAVVREALEETAYDFAPTALLGVYLAAGHSSRTGEAVTYLRFAFRGKLGRCHEGRALEMGIVRTVWMTPEEIRASAARHRSPMLLQCVEDHLAGKQGSLDVLYTHVSALTAKSVEP